MNNWLRGLGPATALRMVAAFLGFLCLWEGVARSGLINKALFPPPSAVAEALVSMAKSGELGADVLASLRRALVGFFFGSLFGVVLGILTGRSTTIDSTIGQLIQIVRPIPSIAIVPLAIVWFGLGDTSKYFLVFWGVFFPVWVNAHLGAGAVPVSYIWAARSLGARGVSLLWGVIFPASVPSIVAGMRTGIAIAFICLVAAEMAGAYGGVGYRIYASHLVFRVDKMMVGIVTLGVMGATADRLFALAVARLLPWYGKTNHV